MEDQQLRSNCETASYHGLVCLIVALGKIITAGAGMLLLVAISPQPAGAAPQVVSAPPSSFVLGKDAPHPTPGTQGAGTTFNSLFYVRPGEGQEGQSANPSKHQLPNEPFNIAYTNPALPVATNDWWTGIGLQWFVKPKSVPPTFNNGSSGWAYAYENGFAVSHGALSEPWWVNFVDYTNTIVGGLHGLLLWNQSAIFVRNNGKINNTGAFDPSVNIVDRAFLPVDQPVVTVGLKGVHPLGTSIPSAAPWTNVRVESYSDWGVVLSYTNNGSKMRITMANGSPFVWFERVSGTAPLVIWAGSGEPKGSFQNWSVAGKNYLGLTVTNDFNPDNADTNQQVYSTAAYAAYADKGTWTETPIIKGKVSMFVNNQATRVAVVAMPQSISQLSVAALQAAAQTYGNNYACRMITDTRIDYPPITGSQNTVTIGGQVLPLGYDVANSVVRYQMRATTTLFPLAPNWPQCANGTPLQVLLPHHVKELNPGLKSNLQPQWQWTGVNGPITGYIGSAWVDSLRSKGMLSILPAVLAQSTLKNPLNTSQLAVDDVYRTMTNWFFLQENQPVGSILSFVRNIGTYDGVQFNTYQPNLQTLVEAVTIADQLAKSPQLTGNDNTVNKFNACLCKPKTQVAAQMRDYILRALEELLGQWADVYTAQLLQYNPQFFTTYGFPAGFGSVQNLNDHHFHYGYFLRALAVIGRYDRRWFNNYLPLIEQLRHDVANFDRTNTKYPFLRNFSPFYGHSWADGTSLDGANQESTSEAINFATGLIEIGQLLGNSNYIAIGTYMYEQEIAGAEQYWFNQDANLSAPVMPPNPDPNIVEYNGNWPQQFVTFTGPDGNPWHTTLIGIENQRFVMRNTFFGFDPVSSYFIHLIPMSANTLYVGRNQNWLKATWKQFLLDANQIGILNKSVFEVYFASLQARLPDSGSGITGTGLVPALSRIANPHTFRPDGTNTTAKYWAYSNSLLGQVDTSVVANTPTYGVFTKAGGGTTYVAYNPTNAQITVTFKKISNGATVTTLAVAPFSIGWKGAAGTSSFTPGPLAATPVRLYLQPATTPDITKKPLKGIMTNKAGTWLPVAQTYTFPASDDLSEILPSLSVVPKSQGICDASVPPGPGNPGCPTSIPAFAQWQGTFSGNLINSRSAHTLLNIYTNLGLGVGWQQNPGVASTTFIRVIYDFDSSGTADRIEIINLPPNSGNSFVIGQQKMTDYYFACYASLQLNAGICDTSNGYNLNNGYYGLNTAAPTTTVWLDDRFGKPESFPASVACGTITVQLYGSVAPDSIKRSVPVSTGTDPLLNRASWVQTPYGGGQCGTPARLVDDQAITSDDR